MLFLCYLDITCFENISSLSLIKESSQSGSQLSLAHSKICDFVQICLRKLSISVTVSPRNLTLCESLYSFLRDRELVSKTRQPRGNVSHWETKADASVWMLFSFRHTLTFLWLTRDKVEWRDDNSILLKLCSILLKRRQRQVKVCTSVWVMHIKWETGRHLPLLPIRSLFCRNVEKQIIWGC